MKFTTRDLFWLVLVLAILCGWFAHSRRISLESARWEAEYRSESAQLVDERGANIILEKKLSELAYEWAWRPYHLRPVAQK
jgi:hypothetical protein